MYGSNAYERISSQWFLVKGVLLSNWTEIENEKNVQSDGIWESNSLDQHIIVLSLEVTRTNYAYKSTKHWGNDQIQL